MFADAIKARLRDDAEVTVWDEGLFLIGSVTLDELLTFPYRFDAAILVLAPDDLVVKRGVEARSPRDNVLFELGVFMSTLGPKKTYVVTTDRNVELPSDLRGLTIARVDSDREDGNVDAMVGTACHDIRTAMRAALAQPTFGLLPSTALARGYFENFVRKVCSSFGEPGATLTMSKDGQEPVVLDTMGKQGRFVILLPEELEEHRAYRGGWIRNLVRTNSDVWKVSMASGQRPFPFYTYLRASRHDVLEFFDIPTTLATSLDAVDACLPGVGQEVRDRVRRRENRNFRREIELRLRDFGQGDMVRFEHLGYLA